MTLHPSVSAPAVSAADFPGIRWRGSWIWCEQPAAPRGMPMMDAGEANRPEVHALFRKTFSLAALPGRAPARITADSRYLLYVNGKEVFRGPVRGQPRRMMYDFFDLAPYLLPGENTLAVYVTYYGGPKSFWMPAPAGAPLGSTGVMVFEADLGSAWLVSDGSWKALKSDAWDEDWRAGSHLHFFDEGIPLEAFDARRFPFGWEQPGFADAAWPAAAVLTPRSMIGAARSQPPAEPYGPLYPRPIAKLGGECLTPLSGELQLFKDCVDLAVGDPVKRLSASFKLTPAGEPRPAALPLALDLPAGGSARLLLDMGRIGMGQVQFELEAPAGTVLELSYTEDPLAPPTGGFLGMHSGTRYTARGENDRFKVYDALGFRFANLLIHGGQGRVVLRGFSLQEDVYPWQPGAAFACSDETLNRIYQAGIRTVQLNSRDSFTDCPTREQQAWVGDSVVHQMVHLVSNPDWRLAWHYLTLSDSPRADGILPMTVVGPSEAAGGMTIPDWSLHWVHGVYNLYRFSGDREALLSYLPSVARVLRWFTPFQNAQGQLEDIPEWALIDWSAVSVSGVSSIYTAIWARALREFAEIAAWLGENASREWAEKLYARAKEGFEIFWDEARGSYIDHIVDGEKRPEMSQLAGALAVVSGLAPRERWQRIVAAITDPERLVIRTWNFDADDPTAFPDLTGARKYKWDVANQIVLAEPFMSYVVHDAVAAAGLAERLPQLCRRWSQFLSGGYDTIGEDWRHGTHVHGWSCTPTKDLVFYTLGVTPAEPGYAAARIAPNLGGLAWAEGKVPTPHGLISLRVDSAALTVDSPVPLLVELPGKAAQRLPAGNHQIRV